MQLQTLFTFLLLFRGFVLNKLLLMYDLGNDFDFPFGSMVRSPKGNRSRVMWIVPCRVGLNTIFWSFLGLIML